MIIEKENKIVFGGFKGGDSPRKPHEVPEGVNSLTGTLSTASGYKLDLIDTKITVIDLLCEGQIQGLATGRYLNSGTLNNIGWDTSTFKANTDALDTSTKWLQSIYWNDTPVVGEDGKFNFQQVNVNYTKGNPNGASVSDDIVDELTFSRVISERLRGGGEEFAKIYRILNKDCISADINVRINQFVESSTKNKTLGDIQQTSIDYFIYYRPIFNNRPAGQYILAKTENITGKITTGYIRSSRIEFDRDYSTDNNFLGWEIKIVRTTEDSTTSSIRNQSFVDSLTEIYGNKYIYPNSAIVSSLFDAEYFSQIPERKFLVDLIKVKVPSNYDPITKTYDESSPWDGTFKTDSNGDILKQWTDNPAWCYYDLLTNKRYGLGLYIDEDLIDKITLYQISKYCDTLVPDGFGGLEPRFTCNVYINSSEEAYKLINSMASIFRAITYYSAGLIYTSQDSEKQPVYQFTNANVVDSEFTYGSSAKKARHTVAVVRYNDKDNFYKPAIEYVENVEAIRKYGLRDVEVPAFGCASRGQAVRLGRWALLTEAMEYESVSFSTTLEASFLRPGDIFQVLDNNRNYQRLGGRLFNIVASPSSTHVVLDSTVTGIDTNAQYKFSLLTPSFYYDASLVTGLDSSDIDNIRRPQMQSMIFSGNQIYNSGNRTVIDFNTALDYTNYNVSGNLVWIVEGTGNVVTGSIGDEEWQTYRVLNIRERDTHVYDIEGLQYDINKFNQIDSGFSFSDTVLVSSYSTPPAPSGLQLSGSILSEHSKLINFSFVPPQDISNVAGFKVFVKTSSFSVGDEQDSTYLAQELPNTSYNGTYFPSYNGYYYFRVYSINYQGFLSSSYAENSILMTNINPLQDVQISSLQLVTGELLLDSVGNKTSDTYSTDSPEYGWQIGINGVNITDISYRITARAPSANNTPSADIYYEISGYTADQSNFTFEFDDNADTISRLNAPGPFREYDLVVEAMDSDGNSSAGGNFITSVSRDATYNNPNGYDILYCNNPRPTAITLYTGSVDTDFYQNNYATQQWITQDGEIKIYLSLSGKSTTLAEFFNDDIAGNIIYYSDLPFTAEEAKQQITVSPVGKIINTINVAANSNPITAAAGLFDIERQYIAIAPYDSFDQAKDERTSNYLLTGLALSNVVEISNPSSAGSYRAWVEIELTYQQNKHGHSQQNRLLSANWIAKSHNVVGVSDKLIEDDNGKLIEVGAIEFASPLSNPDYTVVIIPSVRGPEHPVETLLLNRDSTPIDNPYYLGYLDLFGNDLFPRLLSKTEQAIYFTPFITEIDATSDDYSQWTMTLFVGVMYR